MGVVKLAEQGALKREVAVKTLRDEFLDADFVARLTREARITGMVEHPNIVPIYALQSDERGAPLMVMKRIEGVSWRALLRDPAHPSRLVDTTDVLAFHLRVLLEVCDAVHYAHSRGILHLDLKPDNVMLGHFRDVYVVDWGVAVSTREEHRGLLPLADEVSEVLGTPAYIAPEMVDISHARLGVFTDVYLLGAILYEILVGHPPHRGETLRDTLFAAYEGRPPEIPTSAPSELAAIARRALDAMPLRRFDTVEHFRHAISSYLEHRQSAALSAESRIALAKIVERVEKSDEDGEDALLHRRFSEVRFGFAQALREWPENVDAQDGLVECTFMMVRHHLDRDDAASAQALLAELRFVGDRYTSELTALRERADSLRKIDERIRKLSSDMDDRGSRKARGIYVLAVLGLIIVPVLVGFVLQLYGYYTWAWWHSIVYTVGVAGVLGGLALLMRDALMPNRMGRRYVLAIVFLATTLIGRRLLSHQLGHDEFADVATDYFVFAVGSGVIGVLTDRRFFAPAVAFFIGAIGVAFVPAYTLLIMSITAIVGPGTAALLWLYSDPTTRDRRHRRADRARARRARAASRRPR
jgi:tRNA A-37 threonylcarbamoyl transferase component Bud32